MIYLIGSLRNKDLPVLGNELRAKGFDIFDDWHSAGPEADDYWQAYEKARGRSYGEALKGAHAVDVFNFDKRHLLLSEAAVLVMPAGKSAHLELGWVAGRGILTFVYFPDGEPERYDVMYQFADAVVFDLDSLVAVLKKTPESPLAF